MPFNFQTVKNWTSTGVSAVTNFTGSVLRNTLVGVSNVLPDFGLIGSLGDTIGNAFHIGGAGTSGAPYSGGGSGGSFLNPLGLSPFKADAAELNFSPTFETDSNFGLGSPGTGPTELSGASKPDGTKPVAPKPVGPKESPGGSSASETGGATIPAPDASSESGYDIGAEELVMERTVFTPKPTDKLSGKDLADALSENITAASDAAYDKMLTEEGRGGLIKRRENALSLIKEATNDDGTYDPDKLEKASRYAGDLYRSANAENGVEAEYFTYEANIREQGAFLKESPPLDPSVLSTPAGKSMAANVRRLERDIKAFNATSASMTPQARTARIKMLSDRVTATRDNYERLGATETTRFLNKYDGFGNNLGVDMAALGTWMQYLTPLALAGVSYVVQSRADERNREYMDKVRAEDRAETARLQTERLNAQIQMAGIGAEESAPSSVGASRTHTIGGGTSAA